MSVNVKVGLIAVLSKALYHPELQVVLGQQDMPFTLCPSELSGEHGTHVRRTTQALVHSRQAV
jgi:hypothetical protein